MHAARLEWKHARYALIQRLRHENINALSTVLLTPLISSLRNDCRVLVMDTIMHA